MVNGEIGAAGNLKEMCGPVLNLELTKTAANHVANLDEMVGLCGSSVASLTIPVFGSLAINHGTGKTNDLCVTA